MTEPTTPLAVTYAPSHDSPPHQGELTWEKLIEAMSGPELSPCTLAEGPGHCVGSECLHKKASQMWAPIRWKPEARRKTLDNVAGVSALGIDVDHIGTDDELAKIYQGIFAWRHFVHATHSDRPGDRCIRVVLAVSREMTAAEASKVRAAAVEMLELPADKRARDPSRLYYAPSRPNDAVGPAVDGTGYFFAHGDGRVLDVDAVIALSGPDSEVAQQPSEFVIPEFEGAPTQEKLLAAAITLGNAWPQAGTGQGLRHAAQLALAGGLARAGWPVDLIATFCSLVAEADQPGNADYHKRHTAARSTVEKARTGAMIEGWPSLIEYVGEEAVAAARAQLGLESGSIPEPDQQFLAFVGRVMRPAPSAVPVVSSAPPAPVELPPAPAPTTLDLSSHLRATQKKLASRKDPVALRDAELLRRVERAEMLAEPHEDGATPLAHAAIAVIRAAPAGTTDEQIIRELVPVAGRYLEHLPSVVAQARQVAVDMPSILSRSRPTGSTPADLNGAGLREFVLEQQGVRAQRPANGNQHNIRVALAIMDVKVQHNELAGENEIVRNGVVELLDDAGMRTLRNEMERIHDFKPSKDDLWDTVDVIARESSYHPVKDYLARVETEQTERNDWPEMWLIRLAGAKDTPYVRAVSRLMLVAAVRRIRQPGVKFDEMLVLETPEQGKSKSKALRALAVRDDWFTDDFTLQHGKSRENIEQSSGAWIVEAGELRGMSQGDHNALKQYLARQFDKARMAYDRKTRRVPRQFVMFGTTNDRQYLKDQSGNRRIWPVRVVEFDVAGLKAILDSMWAEASRLEREDPREECIRLHPSLYADAALEQAAREIDTPYRILLDDALDGAVGRIRIMDVWKICGFAEDNVPNPSQVQTIATTMNALGYEREKVRVGGSHQFYYLRGSGIEREIPLIATSSGSGGWKVRAGTASSVQVPGNPGLPPFMIAPPAPDHGPN